MNELRPTRLAEVIGHARAKRTLRVLLRAAQRKHKPLPPLLFTGPPGLGKTTMASVLAAEMDAPLWQAHAEGLTLDAIRKQLQTLAPGTVLFIDEIHSLPAKTAEIYYGVMEDGCFTLDGQQIQVPPCTVIGATTHSGSLPEPLRRRFAHIFPLDFLEPRDLATIAWYAAWRLGTAIEAGACWQIALRAKGAPRRAVQLVEWLADCAQAQELPGTLHAAAAAARPQLVEALALQALRLRGIDQNGLDELDRRYLAVLAQQFSNGPAGVRALSAALGEPEVTLIREVEPWLIREGWIALTPGGRVRVASAGRRSRSKAPRAARRPARLRLKEKP